ncbi:hypothetical protein F7Y47_00625 [Vibrio sp. 1-2-3a]|uniref:Uncharacterized protein n=1 Tax=Vibrio diabolicus TaxID=50719 RepID=A0ABM6SIL2_9VIBR|nr:hypothetical protein AL537_22650 [Vibrio diabolicus]MDU9595366.1 hypothetical protein [Vibrio sp. 2-1-2a]MDU9600946.1 hypothetical protein [Vibrio sp. 1-2-3a]NNN79590.1 hypothetical protein [Vibrio sp. 11-4(1)]AVH30134.1 hypothetical protein AL468_23845 [Vibrio diabolicus]
MKTTNTFKWEEDKPINNTERFKQSPFFTTI